MNRMVLILGGMICVPLILVLALALTMDPRTIDSPLEGRQAPNFTLTDYDGNVVQLEAFRGKPVVVNFWATWCQPCIAEHEVLREASQMYAGRINFLGVIYQDDRRLVERFLQQRGAYGLTLDDADSEVSVAYGVYGIPETYVIDAEGVVIKKFTGPVYRRTLFPVLQDLI